MLKTILKILIVLFLAGLVVFIDAHYIEPEKLIVTENTFDLFSQKGEPVKIVLISDIHIASQKTGYLEKVINIINKQEPDIILIAGDSINNLESELVLLQPLKDLKATYGKYAVLGNHDHNVMIDNNLLGCSMSLSDEKLAVHVEETLKNLGVEVLKNEKRVVEIKNKKFELVGIDDVWACKNNYNYSNSDPRLPKIFFSHNQLAINKDMINGKALLLSGHAHCGEIRLPFITQALLKAGRFGDNPGGRRQLNENIEEYVTCGVTRTSTGFRFLTNSEISVLKLS